MSFGPARGLDFTSFCKVVKTMQFVIIDGRGGKVEKYDIPLKFYNVPIFNFKV